MATTTTNLGLTKPATTDNVDVSVLNANMELIDAAVGRLRSLASGISAGASTTINMSRGVIFVLRGGGNGVAAEAVVDQWSGVTMLHSNANVSVTCASNVVTVTNNNSFAVSIFALYS